MAASITGKRYVLVTRGEYSDYAVVGLIQVAGATTDGELEGAVREFSEAERREHDAAYVLAKTLYAQRGGQGDFAQSPGWDAARWKQCYEETVGVVPSVLDRMASRFGGRVVDYFEAHDDY